MKLPPRDRFAPSFVNYEWTFHVVNYVPSQLFGFITKFNLALIRARVCQPVVNLTRSTVWIFDKQAEAIRKGGSFCELQSNPTSVLESQIVFLTSTVRKDSCGSG